MWLGLRQHLRWIWLNSHAPHIRKKRERNEVYVWIDKKVKISKARHLHVVSKCPGMSVSLIISHVNSLVTCSCQMLLLLLLSTFKHRGCKCYKLFSVHCCMPWPGKTACGGVYCKKQVSFRVLLLCKKCITQWCTHMQTDTGPVASKLLSNAHLFILVFQFWLSSRLATVWLGLCVCWLAAKPQISITWE